MAKSSLINTPMLTPMVVGAGPVIRTLCEEIGFVEAVNQTVAWDSPRGHLSPGERLFALIVHWLTARRPLYRVHAPCQWTDVALLLGSGRTTADFTDDALGRALWLVYDIFACHCLFPVFHPRLENGMQNLLMRVDNEMTMITARELLRVQNHRSCPQILRFFQPTGQRIDYAEK